MIERLDSGVPGLDKPRFRKLRAALAAWRDDLAVSQAPALPDAVLQAESRFQPVTPAEVAAAKTSLAEAVGKLDAYLAKSGANGEGWRAYLKWPVLKEQLAAAKPDGDALGSVYKQFIPLVNASKKPGEWQVYDVVLTAPTFNGDGSGKTPAAVTAFHNGVLIQDHVVLRGETVYIGPPSYKKYDAAPIKLQAHGDPSPPISFRNIWVRELP